MRDRVVGLLREMADALRGVDPFRSSAYRRAAEAIAQRNDFEALVARGRLRAIEGVGPSIERTIVDFLRRDLRPAWLDDAAALRRGGTGARVAGAGAAVAVDAAYDRAPFAQAPDLHVHTTWSDGTMTVEEVVVWAQELGAPAVGISDHSASLRIARGLTSDEVRAQWDEIARVQEDHPDILILRGTECDIKRDGSLDHPADLLAQFDYVIASLHTQLRLDKREQTRRVLRALDAVDVTILGHPTTRVPGRRPPANLDLARVFEKAAARGVAVEVNGNPGRLDLDVPLARQALAAGCQLACVSDGHSAREMLSFAHARSMAREAGATEADLVNFDVMGSGALIRRRRSRASQGGASSGT